MRLAPVLLLSCGLLSAQGHTAAQAETLVKRAIAYARQNGMEKLIAQTNAVGGVFHVGQGSELYLLVYDLKGVAVANGFKKELVGTNRFDAKDVDGKFYVREYLSVAKAKGNGWVDYKFANPMDGKIEPKTAYVEAYDAYLFCCGIYGK